MSENQFGWHDDPREVEGIVSQLPSPLFAITAGDEIRDDSPRDVWHWDAEEFLFGETLRAHNQTIGDCFHGSSIVMGDTIRFIQDVEIGDYIWTAEGKRTRVISKVAKIVNKPLLQIKPIGGLPITVTADHKMLVYRMERVNGKRVNKAYYEREGGSRTAVATCYENRTAEWVRAEDLTDTDYLLTTLELEDKEDYISSDTPDMKFMFGYFAGNGSLSNGTVEFSLPIVNEGERVLSALRFLGYNLKIEEKETHWRIRIHSVELVKWFRGKFYDQYKQKKFPTEYIGDIDFINGLIDADGHDNGEVFKFDSTSKSLIYGVFFSLLEFGFESTIGGVSRSKGTYANAKPLYRISWRYEKKKNYCWKDDEYFCRPVESVSYVEGPNVVYDVGVSGSHHSLIVESYGSHNCVSHGGGRAAQDLLFMDLMRRQLDPDDPTSETSNNERAYQIVTEATYALSRVEIGNGRLGNGDGSIGAWAAKASNQYGVLQRMNFEDAGYDLRTYSGKRAKDWGMPRAGCPDVLEPYVKEHPVKTVSLITSADDARVALQNRYPIAVCSQQGFKTQRRNDGTGICDPKGSWAHCMLFRGFMILRGNKHVLTLQQSWGNSPSGSREVNLESGETITLPEGCFNIEMSVADKMLSRNPDSFAYSGGTGFKRQS